MCFWPILPGTPSVPALRARPFRRRRSRASPAGAHLHRVCLARAFHSQFAAPPVWPPSWPASSREFTVVDLPSFKADPETARGALGDRDRLQFCQASGPDRWHLLCRRDKEIRVQLFELPDARARRHAHALFGQRRRRGDAAIYFGLSGTGKTTLSADPERTLLGDDEHGWSEDGIFNFEGGCYAKTIHLSSEAEPRDLGRQQPLWHRAGKCRARSDNARARLRRRSPDGEHPLRLPARVHRQCQRPGTARHPSNVVMLAADAFGVLPPIAKLTPSQAMYHFLSGYTAKVAGTEKGLGSEPQATFSTCFGAPFMPRHPSVYGNMLRELIARHNVDCWLVNTGWTGGKFGVGRRMPIKVTRALLNAALSGLEKPADAHRSGVRLPGAARSRASSTPSSIRARPGRTSPPTTPRPAHSSTCSARTSPSSKCTWMPR